MKKKHPQQSYNPASGNHTGYQSDDESLKEIWNITGSLNDSFSPEDADTEEALKSVHERLGFNRANSSKTGGKPGETVWLFTRYLVAAVALLIFASYLLFVPASVTVPNGEMAVVEMRDGSTAELNSGATLSYNRIFYGRTNRDVTLNGEAYFSVNSGHDPFRVNANGSVTEVMGTEFNVRSWASDPGSETTVSVTAGEVRFYPANREAGAVTLTSGLLSRWSPQMEAPSSPSNVDTGDVTGWRDRRLIFREQPLIVIVKELERRFNVQIDLEVPGVEMETITAYYSQPSSAASVLDDISMVKGLRYAETANGYRIFK
jgi:transmembrane sensor